MKKNLLGMLLIACCSFEVFSQEKGALMTADTTNMKMLFSKLKKIEYVGFSGYMQPQFQIAQTPGIKSFNGGNFPTNINNRFMLRRGRLRIDFARYTKDNMPKVNLVFQFDGTERGFFIRDFWGRVYENKLNYFSLTTGMFARPMGYEINLGSSDRESLERGRMSQILMKTERDLGAMVSFEPKGTTDWRNHVKFDFGVFNGTGLTATTDIDSHKDLISRLSLKSTKIGNNLILSGSISGLFGGFSNRSQQAYQVSSNKEFELGSAIKVAPRQYRGADFQLKIPNRNKMFTEIRAEYIVGRQSSSENTTETPATLPNLNGIPTPFYIRKFDGAYFYFLQNFINPKNQFVAKYDWYDPNKMLSGDEITDKVSLAEIKFNTLGLGYIRYANENLKFVFYYEMPKNETTQKKEYTSDLKDNLFTCRVQYRF
ncbi:porin [Lacihabitans sp. LS3-19]|uniref:porin n=1 Tax=Lacihabitans sp. LS3-19 TaxID=2487335 RepID=UPI0020CF3996|nr:porin [Lacihabitans sp. LS3-19]MCP9767960.1 porin [Lacihabitans sp. LS3-19]